MNNEYRPLNEFSYLSFLRLLIGRWLGEGGREIRGCSRVRFIAFNDDIIVPITYRCLQTCINRYREYISMDVWGDEIWLMTIEYIGERGMCARARASIFTRHDDAHVTHCTYIRASHIFARFLSQLSFAENGTLRAYAISNFGIRLSNTRRFSFFYSQSLARRLSHCTDVHILTWYYRGNFARTNNNRQVIATVALIGQKEKNQTNRNNARSEGGHFIIGCNFVKQNCAGQKSPRVLFRKRLLKGCG